MSTVPTVAQPTDRPTPGPGLIDGERFRRALGLHAAGVVVITAEVADEPVGLTATSFTSVSLDPPLVSFYIARSSGTWPKLRRAEHFGVHLLTEEQSELATRFATRGVDRFAAPTEWHPGPNGVPLLGGVVAHLLCRRQQIRSVGDHWLVVGALDQAIADEGRRSPLLYHRGGFGGFLPGG